MAEREQQRDHDDKRGNLDRRTDGGMRLGSYCLGRVQLWRDRPFDHVNACGN